MDKDRLRYLLEKHVHDTISPIELDELFVLLQETDIEKQEEVLTDILEKNPREHKLGEIRRQLLYQKTRRAVLANQKKFNTGTSPIYKITSFKKYIAVAAVVLAGLFTLLWILQRSEHGSDALTEWSQQTDNIVGDIFIGNDSVPFIQMPNGKIQFLEGTDSNSLAQLGIEVEEGVDGEEIYRVQRHTRINDVSEQQNIVFSTPKGRSSTVVLIDGTQVWLNSGSSLEFPASFSDTERRVKLVGEAYFDVEQMVDKPFYVETEDGPLIEVLGTAFNVSAYKEDGLTTTTLLEGSVQLLGENHQVILAPNEQVAARIDDAVLKKELVNAGDFISWKDGYFSFNGHSVPEILASVRRWYDITEIDYTFLPTDKFTGTFKRTKSLKSLLLKLEKISNVKFEIQERRIVVMN